MTNDLEKSGIPAAGLERRLHSRQQAESLAYIEIGEDNGGIILNLSEGGLAIQAAEILTGVDLPRLRFQLSSASDWVNVSGQIVWQSESRKTAGIQFINLPEAMRTRIANWISWGGSSREFKPELPAARQGGKSLAEGLLDQSLETVQKSIIENAEKKEDFWAPYPPGFNSDVSREHGSARLNTSTTIRSSVIFSPTEVKEQKQTVRSRKPEKSGKSAAFVSSVAVISLALGIGIGNGSLPRFLRDAGKLVRSLGQETLASASNYLHPGASSLAKQGEFVEPVNGLSPVAQPSTAEPRAIVAADPTAPGGVAPSEAKADPHGDIDPSPKLLPDHPQNDLWITMPNFGAPPRLLNLPPKTVSATSLIAISSERSLVVQPADSERNSGNLEKLQIGNLMAIVEPQYPPEAIRNQTEDVVKVCATVSQDGKVTSIERVSGTPLLTQAAIAAVSGWRYKPTLLNGQRIETLDNIIVEFRLP